MTSSAKKIEKALLAVPKSVKGVSKKTEQAVRGAVKPGQPDIPIPPKAELLAPSPQPIPGRAEDEAKKKVRRRASGKGRAGTIKAGGLLAGRLNQQRNILRTRLG